MNPLLLDFPSEFSTQRLFIRMPTPGDGQAVHKAINASIKELRPWMTFVQKEQTECQMEADIRIAHIKFLKREDLRLLLFLKETGEFIGSSGLHRIEWGVPKFEIGYWLHSQFSGKGYMTEAVEGIMGFAFNELKANRVEIRCDSKNIRSRAIPEKLGFRLEGILENNQLSVDETELRDTCVYAKKK